MTLDEARANIGNGVVYRRDGWCDCHETEDGTITSVSSRWVFVRYGYGTTSKATDPADLELLAVKSAATGEGA